MIIYDKKGKFTGAVDNNQSKRKDWFLVKPQGQLSYFAARKSIGRITGKEGITYFKTLLGKRKSLGTDKEVAKDWVEQRNRLDFII